MINLAVDCMGSDQGSQIAIEGILRIIKEYDDIFIYAVGKKEELASLASLDRVEIVDASDVVPMTIGPLEIMRARNSSMYKAISLMKDKQLDGVVSAGSTGGFLSCATIKLKLIDGIQRAALISPFPTKTGKPTVILDIGANNENTAEQLVQFALMGKIYSQKVLNVEKPQVYLLSNGIEEEKGPQEVKEAHRILKESSFEGFAGNVESRDALDGHCDVIVTGGYAGNVFLKSSEGMAKMMSSMIKEAFYTNIFSKIGYLLSKKGFKKMKKTMNYEIYGGAMLVGVNGVVVKAHGSSNGFSFYRALCVAYDMAKKDVVNLIKEGVNHD